KMLGNPESFQSHASVQKDTNTPTLDSLARDLTQMAREEQLDPVIGRSKETTRVIDVLSRRTSDNPVLIGAAGVGDTAVAQALAHSLVNAAAPGNSKTKR